MVLKMQWDIYFAYPLEMETMVYVYSLLTTNFIVYVATNFIVYVTTIF